MPFTPAQDRDEVFARKAGYLPEEEAEEKRGVNWQIQKNKGLTPARSKTNNPRVKGKVRAFVCPYMPPHVRAHTRTIFFTIRFWGSRAEGRGSETRACLAGPSHECACWACGPCRDVLGP